MAPPMALHVLTHLLMFTARILLVSVAFVALACSGTSSSGIVDPVSTETASTEPTLPSGSATGSKPSTPAEPAPAPDAGKAPAKEEPACTPEIESNDDPARANALLSCVTGVLESPDDTDVFRTVVPGGARRMRIQHKETGGKVHYRVSEENAFIFGLDFTLVEDDHVLDVRPGMSLVFRVSFTRIGKDDPRRYELAIAFE